MGELGRVHTQTILDDIMSWSEVPVRVYITVLCLSGAEVELEPSTSDMQTWLKAVHSNITWLELNM